VARGIHQRAGGTFLALSTEVADCSFIALRSDSLLVSGTAGLEILPMQNCLRGSVQRSRAGQRGYGVDSLFTEQEFLYEADVPEGERVS
jgi:inosine/xanthosine triphosphate pyrophosphatase family protein